MCDEPQDSSEATDADADGALATVTAVDPEGSAGLLLEEARRALASAEARVATIETKASWMLSGLVPSSGLVAVGVYSQTNGADLEKALPLAIATTGGLIVGLLLAAVVYALRVIDLCDFHLIGRQWFVDRVEEAENGTWNAHVSFTLGLAHGTLMGADSVTERANKKIEIFRSMMKLVRLSVWAVIPYAMFTIIQLSRSAS